MSVKPCAMIAIKKTTIQKLIPSQKTYISLGKVHSSDC